MQITPTSSNTVSLSAALFSNVSRYFLLFLKMFPTCDRSIWFVMPFIFLHFATSMACYSYKCSLVFKQTIGHLVILAVLFVSMTKPLTVLCFSIKFTQPLSLGLRICLQTVKMTVVLLFALFSEVNWSLCKHAVASAWLHIEITFDGTVAGLWLLAIVTAKFWLPGCD